MITDVCACVRVRACVCVRAYISMEIGAAGRLCELHQHIEAFFISVCCHS